VAKPIAAMVKKTASDSLKVEEGGSDLQNLRASSLFWSDAVLSFARNRI